MRQIPNRYHCTFNFSFVESGNFQQSKEID
nr:MAG TPA: hypothetical protein [Caudoviricetes sp.]